MKLSHYVGKGQNQFGKAGLLFGLLGYAEPKPHFAKGGAYAMNIADQYVADLSQPDALMILDVAIDTPIATLRAWKKEGVGLTMANIRQRARDGFWDRSTPE